MVKDQVVRVDVSDGNTHFGLVFSRPDEWIRTAKDEKKTSDANWWQVRELI